MSIIYEILQELIIRFKNNVDEIEESTIGMDLVVHVHEQVNHD